MQKVFKKGIHHKKQQIKSRLKSISINRLSDLPSHVTMTITNSALVDRSQPIKAQNRLFTRKYCSASLTLEIYSNYSTDVLKKQPKQLQFDSIMSNYSKPPRHRKPVKKTFTTTYNSHCLASEILFRNSKGIL